jgi:predicted N-formylglutamate amidohydrolase
MKLHPIITCEHAGNTVPDLYANLFTGAGEILASHRGWDPGARDMAVALAEDLSAPLFLCETTRLLIEANRSAGHEQLYSEYTRHLSDADKQMLFANFYRPYREAVERTIASLPTPVLHLSIHSFTPLWNGKERTVDIGLLFDPARQLENRFCTAWRDLLKKHTALRVEFNEPYQGIDDGFTTYLRTVFTDDAYGGIEVEVNQKFVDQAAWGEITTVLADTVKMLYK